MATWVRPASAPPDQVERQEAGPAEAILDVVAEDPQVEHVAEQVEPAAVQELAGHQRRRLDRDDSRPARQAAVRSAGTTPQRVMNVSSAASPPLASSPSSQANATKQAMIRDSVT